MKNLMYAVLVVILLVQSASKATERNNRMRDKSEGASSLESNVGNGPRFGPEGSSLSHSISAHGLALSINQLEEPVHFPYQTTYSSYYESCPVSLGEGKVLMLWISQWRDTLYCAKSADGGVSWGSPTPAASMGYGAYLSDLSAVRTMTGRLVAVWNDYEGLRWSYSDNNGLSWSTPGTITINSGDRYCAITQTIDGRLWLFYSRYSSSTDYDIYFRTSLDKGSSWSAEETFLASPARELYASVVSGDSVTLYLTYQDNSRGSSDIYWTSSTDGGSTWNQPTALVNSPLSEGRPRVLRQSADTLWLLYGQQQPTQFPNYFQNDIYYLRTADGGNSWSAPAGFTRYAGYDGWHNADLFNQRPFVSFASSRWGQYIYQAQLWYGIIGITVDQNPPPLLITNRYLDYRMGVPIPVQADVLDEAGVSNVAVSYSLEGVEYGPFQMYDDGQHNDNSPSDNIWGAAIGPFQLRDHVFPVFSIMDQSSNVVDVYGLDLEIKGIHDAGNVILSFNDRSQLADEGERWGTSGHWPRENGQDYLFSGGLWVGGSVGEETRVINTDYGASEWSRTVGSPFTLAPGVSDQDGSVTYGDQYRWPALGVQVHQESYQWSVPTRDDFIVFKYTIENTGYSNLTDVFVSAWLDPDVSLQEDAYDDRVGYDSQRGIIYVYDSQNNPSGYIGLKLLGAGSVPHTVHAYINGQDPHSDSARYQYMTNGAVTVPSGSADYRVLLTAQPFSLAMNQSATVAYGIVMGNGLADLQTNADTLEVIYESVITVVERVLTGDIPWSYSLAQNYPNPFNPATTIRYELPRRTRANLRIYDLLGREVAVLVDEEQEPGRYEVVWEAEEMSSGLYFYRLRVAEFVETKKLLLLR